MSDHLSRRTETFVVRVWAEYLEQTPPVWRGEIEHVGSKEMMHFGNLSDMTDCLRRCVLAQHHLEEQEDNRG